MKGIGINIVKSILDYRRFSADYPFLYLMNSKGKMIHLCFLALPQIVRIPLVAVA